MKELIAGIAAFIAGLIGLALLAAALGFGLGLFVRCVIWGAGVLI